MVLLSDLWLVLPHGGCTPQGRWERHRCPGLTREHIGTSFPCIRKVPREWIWSIPTHLRNGPHRFNGWTNPCSTRGPIRNLAGCCPICSRVGAWPKIFIFLPAATVPTESCGWVPVAKLWYRGRSSSEGRWHWQRCSHYRQRRWPQAFPNRTGMYAHVALCLARLEVDFCYRSGGMIHGCNRGIAINKGSVTVSYW